MWLCGLASLTSASRMVYAFARDNGLPFSKYLSHVSSRFGTPVWAIWALAFFALATGFFVNVLSAVVSIATVALYISYGLPIAMSLWARHKRQFTPGPWHLGRFGFIISLIATIWISFIMVVFCLPPNDLALKALGVFTISFFLIWHLRAKENFSGPAFLKQRPSFQTLSSDKNQAHAYI